jgi:hypothetical protein
MISDPTGALDPVGRDQLSRLLAPVALELGTVIARPPTVDPEDWRGPAAGACAELEVELRGRLVEALGDLNRALAAVRSAT